MRVVGGVNRPALPQVPSFSRCWRSPRAWETTFESLSAGDVRCNGIAALARRHVRMNRRIGPGEVRDRARAELRSALCDKLPITVVGVGQSKAARIDGIVTAQQALTVGGSRVQVPALLHRVDGGHITIAVPNDISSNLQVVIGTGR